MKTEKVNPGFFGDTNQDNINIIFEEEEEEEANHDSMNIIFEEEEEED